MQRPRDFSSYLFSQTNWIMSLAFPVNAVCLSSRCVHPCDPLRLQASSALQKLVYSFFLPHISSHCTLSILTCLCVCLPSSRPTQWLQSCILKGYAVSLHEAVTLIYTDAAAGLTHKPRLVNSHLLAIGERKSTMVWQIAFFYFSFC